MTFENILYLEQVKIIIGFLVGAIIGLERQLSVIKKVSGECGKEENDEKEIKPGVRTFGLTSLYGTITLIFVQQYNLPEFLYFSMTSIIVIVAIYTALKYYVGDFGITTPIALTLSYILGVLVGVGEISLSITLSVLITFILASKNYVKGLLEAIEFKEIRSALEIGILFFLLFPMVPDTLDPIFHSVNLRTFYLFLVMVLSLSFIAYITVRKLSPLRGTLTFSTLGALFSSEGVTISLMRMYKEEGREEVRRLSRLGVLESNLVMIIRTIAFTALLIVQYVPIIIDLTVYMLPSILVGTALTWSRYIQEKKVEIGKIDIENPLSYTTATKFVLVFIAITFLVVFFEKVFSYYGILAGSFIGGFVSNLAICLSVASLLTTGEIDAKLAVISILLGTMSAVLNKIIYVAAEVKRDRILKGVFIDILALVIPFIIIIIYLFLS